MAKREILSFTLPQEGLEVIKQRETRSALSSVVQRKFGCSIEFENMEQDAASSFGTGKAKITPEIKYTKQLHNGVNISVWKDDLTTHIVDAVVNAANNDLSHGAGLAFALSEAGGPEINKSSVRIIHEQGLVHTGNAVLASAGNLPCKKIIHAVGPRVPSNPSQKEIQDASELLRLAILSILDITESNYLQSVAIPAISSGLFNFPRQLCANIIVQTVLSYRYAWKSAYKKMEVRLVNNDDPSVQEMVRACTEYIGSSDVLQMSVAVQKQKHASTQSVLPSLVLGNVTLTLKKGSIEDESTDVIVNITGPDLDLSKGLVSVALLKKAGKGIQQEINKFKSWHSYTVPEGEVFETSGCALNCKLLFHTVCASNTNAKQVIFPVVKKCLEKASANKISSISFPAIGTGKLGLQKDEVAQIMIDAAVEFSKSYKDKKMCIYFVIFPKDIGTLKAFERQMTLTLQKLDSGILSITNTKSQISHSNVEEKRTFIMFFGNSKEALEEAKRWSIYILQRSGGEVTINNNHVAQLDQDDHAKLTKIQGTFNVIITEFFKNGKSGIIINGDSVSVSQAALEVELLLCKAQVQFAATEEKELNYWYSFSSKEGSGRTNIDPISHEYTETVKKFKTSGLLVEKVEKIDNPALRKIFEFNEKRMGSKPIKLYQRVNAQFCNLICKVGFQREYAPPKEQKCGAGIYFTTELREANILWPDSEEVYVYIIVARVLTGKSTLGSPGLIIPPSNVNDPFHRYDSVHNSMKDIFVVFNGQQALPEYIITCRLQSQYLPSSV